MDTAPEAHRLQAELYRRMSGADRLAIAFELTETVRQLALSGIRHRHPEYTEGEVQRAYARLLHGDDLCRDMWPDQPLVAP